MPPQHIDYDEERLKLWVRSGGRCALCKKYLLEGELTGLALPLGEGAHIVGRKKSERSPRGMADMPIGARDLAENLILLCPDHHSESDKKLAEERITIEWLMEQKRRHEAWIREVTGLDPKRTTAILRMVASLRDRPVELDSETAMSAVLRADFRFCDFPLSVGNRGIEIDLRQVPDEAAPNADYWRRCQDTIDDVIEHKLVEAVGRGQVKHLSVFALARLPLLAYLGSRLDDTYEVEIYQRQRADESWSWPGTEVACFTITRPDAAGPEAVLVLNVSGIVDETQLPAAIAAMPISRIAIAGPAVPDAITSRASLRAFESAVRDLFASFEIGGKTVRRLHVFGALPISAAVVLGRAHDHVHPALALYDWTDGVYRLALELT